MKILPIWILDKVFVGSHLFVRERKKVVFVIPAFSVTMNRLHAPLFGTRLIAIECVPFLTLVLKCSCSVSPSYKIEVTLLFSKQF